MSEKHWVDDDHYRMVDSDGKTSWLYKADGGVFSQDSVVERADHHEDGSTTAYEIDNSFLGGLFGGFRGKEK